MLAQRRRIGRGQGGIVQRLGLLGRLGAGQRQHAVEDRAPARLADLGRRHEQRVHRLGQRPRALLLGDQPVQRHQRGRAPLRPRRPDLRVQIGRMRQPQPAAAQPALGHPALPAAAPAAPDHQPHADQLARIDARIARHAADGLQQDQVEALVDRLRQLGHPVATHAHLAPPRQPGLPVGGGQIGHQRGHEILRLDADDRPARPAKRAQDHLVRRLGRQLRRHPPPPGGVYPRRRHHMLPAPGV